MVRDYVNKVEPRTFHRPKQQSSLGVASPIHFEEMLKVLSSCGKPLFQDNLQTGFIFSFLNESQTCIQQ